MPTLDQAMGKRYGYFIAGIIVVTASSLASFAIASTGMLCFAGAIKFITKPFSAFIPDIFTTLFFAWAIIYALILHHELTRTVVLFARKKIIKLLRLKKRLVPLKQS